jgi:hypothetical protein
MAVSDLADTPEVLAAKYVVVSDWLTDATAIDLQSMWQ